MSVSLISVAKRPSIRVPKKVIHFTFMVKKGQGKKKILIFYFNWHVFKQCINVCKSLMIACHSSTILLKFLTTAIPSICNQRQTDSVRVLSNTNNQVELLCVPRSKSQIQGNQLILQKPCYARTPKCMLKAYKPPYTLS